jgi:hypothetical protein
MKILIDEEVVKQALDDNKNFGTLMACTILAMVTALDAAKKVEPEFRYDIAGVGTFNDFIAKHHEEPTPPADTDDFIEHLQKLEQEAVAIIKSDTELREAAQAVVERWDSPLWKDLPHTGTFIDRLRKAL